RWRRSARGKTAMAAPTPAVRRRQVRGTRRSSPGSCRNPPGTPGRGYRPRARRVPPRGSPPPARPTRALRARRRGRPGREASFFRDSQDDGHRAVIVRVGVGHAPVEVVVARRPVRRLLALVTVALAVAAAGLPATVVVGEDVIAAVTGVVAGADPGDGRGGSARRTGTGGAAAARAQEAVDGAVLPVLTALGTVGLGGGLARPRAAAAIHWQQRQQRGAGQQLSQGGQQAAA